MADIKHFQDSLSEAAVPPHLDLALQGLWWAGKHEWDRGHACVQQHEGDPRCDWVHAHLHRVEGGMANAGYWYRRAVKKIPMEPIEGEWMEIAAALLASAPPAP